MSKKITGEGLDCQDYSDFMENTLRPLLQEYQPNDICNADETSFFYKMLANRTYAFGDETARFETPQLQRQIESAVMHQHDWHRQTSTPTAWQGCKTPCPEEERS